MIVASRSFRLPPVNFMKSALSLLLLALLATPSLWAANPKPHLVMLIAEREYKTAETLPAFAAKHLAADYRTTLVFADPQDANRLAGIEAVEQADVLLISVRRRTLDKDQLDIVRRYVAAGKPVIGIRTANHAFCLRNKQPPTGKHDWPQWDKQVFGGNYSNHYGNQLQTTVSFAEPAAAGGDLLRGIAADPFTAGGSLYIVSPLAEGAKIYLMGRVPGKPAEPVAWTFRRRDGGKSFYTSLGHEADFAGNVLPKLLVNAIAWSAQDE
jgi:type 1 glutamine amidotransferase